MRKIVAVEHLSLDGVMQSPGAANEDTRGEFSQGGWAAADNDQVLGAELGKGMGNAELLFGRLTYEKMYAAWPNAPQPNPFTDLMNNTPKYVVSATLAEPLDWMNSSLLTDAGAVADLKDTPGPDLVILGSGVLVQALMARDLVDEYKLLVHPVVLGSGRRLFPDGGVPAHLRLTDCVTTTTGVLITTYQPKEA